MPFPGFLFCLLVLVSTTTHTILKGALPAKREAPPVIQPTQLQVQGLPVADSLPFLWNRSVQPPSERGMEMVVSGFLQGGHGILKVMEVA